jgi:hypothetical protein
LGSVAESVWNSTARLPKNTQVVLATIVSLLIPSGINIKPPPRQESQSLVAFSTQSFVPLFLYCFKKYNVVKNRENPAIALPFFN